MLRPRDIELDHEIVLLHAVSLFYITNIRMEKEIEREIPFVRRQVHVVLVGRDGDRQEEERVLLLGSREVVSECHIEGSIQQWHRVDGTLVYIEEGSIVVSALNQCRLQSGQREVDR